MASGCLAAVCLGSFGVFGPLGSSIQLQGIYLDPPDVPLLRALWPLLDGSWGVLKGSWGVIQKP